MSENQRKKDLREEFIPLGKKYQFYERIDNYQSYFFLTVSFLGIFIISNSFIYKKILVILGFAYVVILLWIEYKLTSMKCPGCYKEISNKVNKGIYCSMCGKELIFNHLAKGVHCGSCHYPMQNLSEDFLKTSYPRLSYFRKFSILNKKNFSNKLRFRHCNQCGAHLSDKIL